MAWRALGYASWDVYVAEEFGTNRLRLPREEREEVVCSLRASGLSLRAISDVTGDSPSTVGNVLKSSDESTVQNCTVDDGAQDSKPDLTLVLGRDGKKRRAKRRTNNRFDRITAEQKRMKAEAAKREAAKGHEPRRFPVTGIISDLNAVAVHIGALDQEKMTPTQRRDIAAAITRLAEAIGMHYEGITFDDGGFSMSTPEPEGP
jgi:hypothetical protein